MEQLFEYFNRKLIETPRDLVRYKYVDALAIFYCIRYIIRVYKTRGLEFYTPLFY